MTPETGDVAIWRLDGGRAAQWREIRVEALRLAPEAVDSALADWQDRPLGNFTARLKAVPTFAAGREFGRPLAAASWQAPSDADADDPDRAWLLAVYVRPGAEAQGFARAAIRATLGDASAAGRRSAGLTAVAANAAATALYRRTGFGDSGRRGPRNRRGGPEIEMVLEPLPAHGGA